MYTGDNGRLNENMIIENNIQHDGYDINWTMRETEPFDTTMPTYFANAPKLCTHDLVNKSNYYKKLFEGNKEYNKSLDSFSRFVHNTDDVVYNEPIDPFKNANAFRDKEIRELYDYMTAGPKFKGKNLVCGTQYGNVYENESIENGGCFEGTNIRANDCQDHYVNAKFGNGF